MVRRIISVNAAIAVGQDQNQGVAQEKPPPRLNRALL
jgi:hypothetical protein